MNLRRGRRNVAVLNITPLIDVVFMLLVFFMLTIDFGRMRMIGVETPQEREVARDSAAAIVILLKAAGGQDYDGKPASVQQVRAQLGSILAVDPGRSFIIRPEPGVPVQRAVDMFQTVRDAGAYAVSFSPPREEAAR
jgi:biopolymer transport protein ExbD